MDASLQFHREKARYNYLPTFERIFQSSVDCLKVIDQYGILVRICRSGGVALEYDGECPALGMCWFDFWPQEYQNIAQIAVATAQEQGHGHFVGACNTFRGTLKWWDVLISPLHTDAGNLFFLVASRDISKLKQQERQNLKAIHELEHERRNREQFVATLTHDLRNPLSAARTSAELIIRKAADQPRLLSLASRIDRCLERADAMITDLLDVAKIRSGQTIQIAVEPVDLKQLVDEALHDLSLSSGSRFVLVCETPFVDALCDSHAFRRIVDNLASNALKYGDPTVDITVTLERKPFEVVLCVHNKGPHIDEEECKTLFDLYRRTASAHSSKQTGWGLGLTVVRGLSRALGGDATVTSSAEQGTSFVVCLPQPPELEVNVVRVAPGAAKSASGHALGAHLSNAVDTLVSAPEHTPRWVATVLEGINDAVVASTADGRISFLNRAAEELSGYSNDQGCGMFTSAVLRRLDGGLDRPQDYADVQPKSSMATMTQLLVVAPQGTTTVVGAQITPLYDDAGTSLGLIYILRALDEAR
jgi:PAS domain S-box-containing protein